MIDGELVAAEPRRRILAAKLSLEALGDGAQQAVADGMAQGVVHILEVIDVEAHDGGKTATAPGHGNGVVDPLPEQDAVGQAGQCIVLGHVPDVLLAPLQLADIGVEHHGAAVAGAVLVDLDPAIGADLTLVRAVAAACVARADPRRPA